MQPVATYIASFIDNCGPFDAIIELGCGYGKNLIEIYYGGGPRDIPYIGGELTTLCVGMASRISRLDNNIPTQFFLFDPAKPDISQLPTIRNPLFFTEHSFDQADCLQPEFFRVIANAAPKVTCLHFEYFGYKASSRDKGMTQHDPFFSVSPGFIPRVAVAMRQAEIMRIIKIDYGPNEVLLSHDPGNPTSLSIWSSISERD